MTRFTYRLFGMTLETDRGLAGLTPQAGDGPKDVRIHFVEPPSGLSAPLVRTTAPAGATTAAASDVSKKQTPEGKAGYQLEFADGVRAEMAGGGTQVWLFRPHNVAFEQVVRHLLYSVLQIVLHLRQTIWLYGAALAVGDRAFVLAGEPGVGKSTLATALATRGCGVLTDDFVALEERRGSIVAHPGYPWLCLRPGAPLILADGEGASLKVGTPWAYMGDTFITCPLDENDLPFARDAVPLAAFYLLDHASTPRSTIEAMSAREGLIALLPRAQSISDAFLEPAERESLRAHELAILGLAVGSARVRRVCMTPTAPCIAQLCDTILADFQ